MEPVALVDVSPAKLVEVLVDGTWYPGELRAWQKLEGRWRGDVVYTVGVGMRKLGWFLEDRLRPVWSMPSAWPAQVPKSASWGSARKCRRSCRRPKMAGSPPRGLLKSLLPVRLIPRHFLDADG